MTESTKGYRRRADIPPEVVRELNAGRREARTLVEGLVVDFGELLKAAAAELSAAERRPLSPDEGITTRMRIAGEILYRRFGLAGYERFRTHRSDTVRGWAGYLLACDESSDFAAKLDAIRPLADDPNAGVREWAWLALRPAIAHDPIGAIDRLRPWIEQESANLRRFAVESTRPRGVWCAHLPSLRDDPEPGLVLLEPLRADRSKYVQDSVANWLNDASKSRPDWVRATCDRWRRESSARETARICKRALRSLD